jgi:hypothetical protein
MLNRDEYIAKAEDAVARYKEQQKTAVGWSITPPALSEALVWATLPVAVKED